MTNNPLTSDNEAIMDAFRCFDKLICNVLGCETYEEQDKKAREAALKLVAKKDNGNNNLKDAL